MFGFAAFAQDVPESTETNGSNNGKQYLPQAGDIGVGIDGTPIFNYVGNMFNGTTNNSLNLGGNTLYFRYFLADDAAVRFVVSINSNGATDRYYVIDDAAFMLDPLSNKQIEDRYTYKQHSYNMSVGYQKFRGTKRLRGFYGADLGVGFYKYTDKYEYGNLMTVANTSPTTHWGNLGVRTLENKGATSINVHLGAFTGAEYYIMPKFCIGAEMGFVYGYQFEGQSYRTQERMVLTQYVEEEIALSPGETDWSAYTNFPYMYGNLYFMFHF